MLSLEGISLADTSPPTSPVTSHVEGIAANVFPAMPRTQSCKTVKPDHLFMSQPVKSVTHQVMRRKDPAVRKGIIIIKKSKLEMMAWP